MIFFIILYTLANLQTAFTSQAVTPRAKFSASTSNHDAFEVTADGVSVPRVKQDFSKNNVSAQWAPEYPRNWGSEDFTLTDGILDPEPFHELNAAFTTDEKYAAIMNGSHITFIDMDTNSTITSTKLEPEGDAGKQTTLRPAPNGEYDVFTTGTSSDGTNVFRQRFSSSLRPSGNVSVYPGRFTSFSENFRMMTSMGTIYDFSLPNSTLAHVAHVGSAALSPNGEYLYTYKQGPAPDNFYTITLWNATSGEEISALLTDMKRFWSAKFSADSKYLSIWGGENPTVIKFYSVSNTTAPPSVLPLSIFRGVRPAQWTPDGRTLAITEGPSLLILKFPQLELVQKLEMDYPNMTLEDIVWLDDGRKIAFLFHYGRWIYDFETNTKWWMNVRLTDRLWADNQVRYLKKRDMFVTIDGDATIRVWKA